MRKKLVVAGFLVFARLRAAQPLDPAVSKALRSIVPSELKGDLSFLASDVLAGRFTPSPGLEVAAEFIASKFRAFGLEPAGKNDYFQLAAMVERKLSKVVTPLIGKDGETTITVEPAKMQVTKSNAVLTLALAPVVKFAEHDPDALKGVNLEGKVVVAPMPDFAAVSGAERMRVYRQMRAFDAAVASSKALAELVVTTAPRQVPASQFLFAEDAGASAPPMVQIESPELAAAITSKAEMVVSLEIPASSDEKVTVKNVIGVLPGSDAQLKSTCVLVTAHYDHIGMTEKPAGEDHIYNGANDDGSGTVSVIEIARALSQLHPKRSIVFMTFFGEERGLLGSTYYGRHPLFPISDTVADVNLEQVGRTDSNAGPEIGNASITGYDYSDVTTYLEDAGKATGIKIYKDDAASDQFFVRSDNAALAEQGVPAHTLTTAFEYPDYHGLGDEWQKIDYENMAKVDRTVALAVLNIANSRRAPAWNEENPKTETFREAQKKSQRLK